MNRRAFLLAGLLSPAVLAPASAKPEISVIYVGGQDCSYCTMWQNRYRKAWLASPSFTQVQWIEIDPPRLREAYRERHWPAAFRPVLEQVPRKSGTPRFLVTQGGRIVSNQLGVSAWEVTLADLKVLLG